MRWLALLLLLAGCVPADQMPIAIQPGAWADYHALVAGVTSQRIQGQAAPGDLNAKLEQCWADDTVAALTPAELDKLNRFARGEQPLTTAQLNEIDAGIDKHRPGRTQHGFDRLSATCPSDIPAFKKYFKLD